MTARILVAIAATLCLGACATNDIQAGKSADRLTASLLAEAAGGTKVRLGLGSSPPGLPVLDVAEYMDRQEAELRAELVGTGVKVERTGNEIVLTLPGNITFVTNSGDIRSDFFPVLNSVSKVLGQYERTTIRVDGHTDSTGSSSINQPLSQRRADSVASYLRSQKVGANRLSSYGHGSKYPIASNDAPAGREQNRRVEITITPIDETPEPSPLSRSSEEAADQDAAEPSEEGHGTDTPPAGAEGSDLPVDDGQAEG